MNTQPAPPREVLKAFDSVPDPYLILSPDLTILAVSDAYLAATFTVRDQLVGHYLFDALPENSASLQTSLQQVLSSRKPHQMALQRYQVLKPQEQADECALSYWRLLNVPVLDESGEVHYLIHKAEDVTEHVLLEQRLNKLEQQIPELNGELAEAVTDKYLTLFNSIDEGFYRCEVVFDEANRPVDIIYLEENPAAVRIIGISFTGKRLREVDPDYEDYWFQIWGAVAITGESKRVEHYSSVDQKWFNFYITKVGDDRSREVAVVFNDVTALKEAQQELQQNRDLLRSVFDVSYNGLSVLRSVRDEEGNLLDMEYILANKATKQTNQRDDLEGKLYSTVHAGFKGTDYFDVVKRVVETGEPHQYQLHYNFEHLDNWYNITTVKLDDGVLLSFEDISEIKKAELALRKSEERHAFLLTLSDVLRPISDPVEIQGKASRVIGEYLNANRTYYAEIDTSRQRAIVKQDYDRSNVQSLVGSHDLQLYAGVIAGMHQERMLIAEDFASTPLVPDHERAAFDALSIRAFVSVPLIKGGTLVASLTVTNDTARRWTPQEVHLLQEVSERTWAAVERAKAQAELRLSEENYQTLFNSIDEGFQHVEVLYDEAGNAVDYLILAQNPAADRLLGPVIRAGYKASEVVPSGTTAAVNPEWLAIYDSVVKTGNPVRRQVYVEPMDRWFDFYMTRSGDPSLHHTVSLFQDVTGSKKTEQALKEADRRKDEFLAMLAHELRNPMAPIRNGLQIMSLTCGDDPMLSSLVDMMNRQVDHLVRLVDDLLDVSRISRGKIELVLERLELGNLVSQAVEAARPQYQQRRVQLGLTLSQTPMYLRGDAARLNQVITNLLTNGVRYTPEGGEVRVTLELVNNESDGTRPDRSALLRVTDTGIGLAPDQLTAVFELFVQMDNSLARSQGGLGLGLTLVRKLVEMHGGWVEAHSKGLSEGSEFRVYLPLLAEPAKTINPATEQASAQLPGHTILVVDDNRDAADSLSMFLALKGHQVHTRYGGREALEAVTTVQPTVVLLDIGMPDLDGYQTCQLIRQQAGNQHIALIALTGYGQVEDKQRSQEAGFYTHVVKPVDLTALTQLLASLPTHRSAD